MEMGKLFVIVSTRTFVTNHLAVFARVGLINTFHFLDNSFYSVILNCLKNTQLKLSSFVRTNKKSNHFLVASADDTREFISLRVSFLSLIL